MAKCMANCPTILNNYIFGNYSSQYIPGIHQYVNEFHLPMQSVAYFPVMFHFLLPKTQQGNCFCREHTQQESMKWENRVLNCLFNSIISKNGILSKKGKLNKSRTQEPFFL